MAKIAQKQVDSINSRCKNGFTFYIRGFIESGRKQLVKTVTLKEDEKMIEIELSWTEEIVYQRNRYGCEVPHRTGNLLPLLRVSVWDKSKSSKAWSSEGFGRKLTFNEYPSTKKIMNKLCEATELVTDELIGSLLPEPELLQFKSKANLT